MAYASSTTADTTPSPRSSAPCFETSGARVVFTPRSFRPEHLFSGVGASAVVDQLTSLLCNEGEGIMIAEVSSKHRAPGKFPSDDLAIVLPALLQRVRRGEWSRCVRTVSTRAIDMCSTSGLGDAQRCCPHRSAAPKGQPRPTPLLL